MNDLITQKLLTAADSIASAITAKAPAALALILATEKIDAVTNLVQGAVGLIGAFIIIYYSVKAIKFAKTINWYEDAFYVFIYVFGGAFAFSLMLVALFCIPNLFDAFNWVGIWHPDIYLAHQVLEKIQIK